MKTVGEILKEARLKKNLSTEEVATALCAKENQIRAIENDDFSVFNAQVFAWGFISAYATEMGIKEEEISPFFRRTFAENDMRKKTKRQNKIYLRQQVDFMASIKKNLSKIVLFTLAITLLVFLVLLLFFQYRDNLAK